MIPQHYDPTPYRDVLEHIQERLRARLATVEALLKTLQKETEQPTRVVILKDSGMLKEWEALTIGKGNSIWESPIGSTNYPNSRS